MCGILAICTTRKNEKETEICLLPDWDSAIQTLKRRGPDNQSLCQASSSAGKELLLGSSLLHIRGFAQPRLPHQSQHADVLLFNGEIFGGLSVPGGQCDSAVLLEALTEPNADIASVLSRLEGPWALIYWQHEAEILWIARDVLGRRSLLLAENCLDRLHGGFVLASTAVPSATLPLSSLKAESGLQKQQYGSNELKWHEVPPGIQSRHLGDRTSISDWTSHGWLPGKSSRLLGYHRIPSSRNLSGAQDIQTATAQVLEALRNAVRIHCTCIDVLPGNSWDSNARPAPILILFSGGVDSTLIAALAHEALPDSYAIDLATICFDNGRSPDRISAIDAIEELSDLAPQREWRLIEINASLQDLEAHRDHLIRLLKPSETVMDLNIGVALWLAARGSGPMRRYLKDQVLASEVPGGAFQQQYRSAARIVLVGHGADEQCAGYGRHRTKFRQKGIDGLAEELRLDVQRLWLRNLGRDDRLIADHGRESRHPFLDENFMIKMLDLPLVLVADLEKPVGVGDKQLLRNALRQLGLPRAAGRVKRAIQFGTRLGKLANMQAFGSNRNSEARHAGTMTLAELQKVRLAG